MMPFFSDCTSLIFETSTVTNASPATMARCAVIHFGPNVVSWKSLVESWFSGAQSFWEISNNRYTELGVFHKDLKSILTLSWTSKFWRAICSLKIRYVQKRKIKYFRLFYKFQIKNMKSP